MINRCPGCGSTKTEHKNPRTYRYRESGLNNIVLHGGVTQVVCRGCGEVFSRVEREQQLLQVIALMLLMKPGYLTGPEMRCLRKAAQLSQSNLATRLGVQRRETIAERESKAEPGLDPGAELLLRGVLLRAFSEYVSEKENDHLERVHHKKLESFAKGFLEVIDRIGARGQKKVFEIRQIKNAWEPELMSA